MSGGITRERVAIFLGAALVLTVVIFWLTQGLGRASVPEDSVAVIDSDITIEAAGIEDGEVSREGFDRALEQTAKQQGQQEAPAEEDEQYGAIRDQAMAGLFQFAWIKAEAEERGIEASDREIQDELERTKNQSFENEREYRRFLRQSGLNDEDVDLRIELNLLSQKIQEQVQDQAGEATEEDARAYYEANRATYEQPEQRDVRLIVNQDAEQVQRALDELEADDSGQSWDRVARRYSTDPSKQNGGLRPSATPGLLPEQVDSQVFSAEVGDLTGPIETPNGTYAFQVESVTEASVQPFEDVSEQLQQQLTQQFQQEQFNDFLTDYRARWTSRTVCADGFVVSDCDNFEIVQAECNEEQAVQTGCPPPVLPNSPAAPGTILPFTPPSGQPQRPHPPGGDDEAPLPTIPGVPGEIPGAPPGTAPGG